MDCAYRGWTTARVDMRGADKPCPVIASRGSLAPPGARRTAARSTPSPAAPARIVRIIATGIVLVLAFWVVCHGAHQIELYYLYQFEKAGLADGEMTFVSLVSTSEDTIPALPPVLNSVRGSGIP